MDTAAIVAAILAVTGFMGNEVIDLVNDHGAKQQAMYAAARMGGKTGDFSQLQALVQDKSLCQRGKGMVQASGLGVGFENLDCNVMAQVQ